MSKSTYLANAILDHILGGPDYTRPATVYLGLRTSGTEVSGSNYARVAKTNNATNFPAASGGAKSNGTIVTFNVPSGSWGTPNEVAIYDASSGGNLLRVGTITTPKAIGSGNDVSFPVGEIDFSET